MTGYETAYATAVRWGVSPQRVYAIAHRIPGAIITNHASGRRSVKIPIDAVKPKAIQGQRSGGKRGSAYNHAAMLALYDHDTSISDIRHLHGCSQSTVYRILNLRGRRHG